MTPPGPGGERQVGLAADVQRRMLPRRLPQIPRLDVAARYQPSFALGGDFYDIVPIGLDRASGGSQRKHRRRLRVRLTVRQAGKRVFGRTIEVSSVGR